MPLLPTGINPISQFLLLIQHSNCRKSLNIFLLATGYIYKLPNTFQLQVETVRVPVLVCGTPRSDPSSVTGSVTASLSCMQYMLRYRPYRPGKADGLI